MYRHHVQDSPEASPGLGKKALRLARRTAGVIALTSLYMGPVIYDAHSKWSAQTKQEHDAMLTETEDYNKIEHYQKSIIVFGSGTKVHNTPEELDHNVTLTVAPGYALSVNRPAYIGETSGAWRWILVGTKYPDGKLHPEDIRGWVRYSYTSENNAHEYFEKGSDTYRPGGNVAAFADGNIYGYTIDNQDMVPIGITTYGLQADIENLIPG
jgi:hypothetical protein